MTIAWKLSSLLLLVTPLDALAAEQWIMATDLWGNRSYQTLQMEVRDGRVQGTLDGDPVAGSLAERAGRVLTRDQIMEAVRGRELEAFDRSIDVHMGRIRAAIEADPKVPQRILTVRGVGYVFARQQD